jgi:hypothetical protein
MDSAEVYSTEFERRFDCLPTSPTNPVKICDQGRVLAVSSTLATAKQSAADGSFNATLNVVLRREIEPSDDTADALLHDDHVESVKADLQRLVRPYGLTVHEIQAGRGIPDIGRESAYQKWDAQVSVS